MQPGPNDVASPFRTDKGLAPLSLACSSPGRGESLVGPQIRSNGLADQDPAGFCVAEAATYWVVLQIADSAFPAGGFAHSNGLEAAWQHGEICSPEQLADFVDVHLAQTGGTALPFLNEAYHQGRPFAELDRLCDVFLSNHVANRCSRAQGQAFLLAAAQAFDSECLANFRTDVSKQRLPGHLAPVLGAVLRMLKISHALSLRMCLFMNLRTLMASAVRLGIIGPMAAQSLQRRLAANAEQIAVRCAAMRLAQAAQSSPLLEIWQGAHDRLYSRLFQT